MSFEVSLYKIDENKEVFTRDSKTSKITSDINEANWFLQQMVTVGTEGYNGCAIFNTETKEFERKAYVDPLYIRDFEY